MKRFMGAWGRRWEEAEVSLGLSHQASCGEWAVGSWSQVFRLEAPAKRPKEGEWAGNWAPCRVPTAALGHLFW